VWRFVQFYIPLWISVIYSGWVFIRVAHKLRDIERETNLVSEGVER
jgi:hypothetical protein